MSWVATGSERVLDCRGATAELDHCEAERDAALVMRKPALSAPDLLLASTSPFIAPKAPDGLRPCVAPRPQRALADNLVA